MLIPCMLAAIVTNIEHEYYQLHFWLIIVLTILSVLYISTVVLTYIAHEKGDVKGTRFFRGRALFWSVPTMAVIALIAILVNGYQFSSWQLFLENWWIFIFSFIAFFRCNALFIPSTSLHMGVVICIHTASICLFWSRNIIIRF